MATFHDRALSIALAACLLGGPLTAETKDEQPSSGFPGSGLVDQGKQYTDDVLAGRKPFLTIAPGVELNSTDLVVSGRNYTGRMTTGGFRTTYGLDLTFRDIPFTDRTGLYVINHNSVFSLPLQREHTAPRDDDGSSSSSDDSGDSGESNSGGGDGGGSGDSGAGTRDFNTRIDGVYSTLIPSLYFDPHPAVRLGAGLGLSAVSMRGTVDFDNGAQQLAAWQTIVNREEWAPVLPVLYQTSGLIKLTSDPLSRGLIATLNADNHLHLLGQYWFLTDRFRPSLFNIALLQAFRGSNTEGQGRALEVTNEEIYALAALQTSYVDLQNEVGGAFMFFIEGGERIRGRISISGPVLRTRGHEFDFMVIGLSAYFPISFHVSGDDDPRVIGK
jgi:hypothetical protein